MSRFSRSCTRLPSHEAIARRQTATWMTDGQHEHRRDERNHRPDCPGPAPAKDGNAMTAAAAATTAASAHCPDLIRQ